MYKTRDLSNFDIFILFCQEPTFQANHYDEIIHVDDVNANRLSEIVIKVTIRINMFRF